jgi:uncharacterized protein (TIGR03437 family)
MFRTIWAVLAFWAVALGQQTGIITTIAGIGVAGFNGDDIPASQARINLEIPFEPGVEEVSHVRLDAQGNVYILDKGNNRVRRIGADGIIRTFAGSGRHAFGGDGGPATQADLDWPNSIAFDANGNAYISDQHNNRIRRVAANGTITTFAGSSLEPGYSGNGGPAAQARLDYPSGVAFDAAGNLYIADTFNNQIRRVTPSGVISAFAGVGGPAPGPGHGFGGDGGPAAQAVLDFPSGMAFDRNGNLYFADQHNNRIRRVTPEGVISTVAGSGVPGELGGGYAGDGGPATSALLNYPADVAFDGAGNLYIADQRNHRIRRVTPDGIISTVVGNGERGFSGDGGPPLQAALNGPSGVAVDGAGNLYITDHYNNRIRRVTSSGFTAAGVVSAASFLGGHVAPGQIISIFGVSLGPAAGVLGELDPGTGRLRTTLSDASVLFNDVPGPLFFVRQDQVNVQVPYEVAGQASVRIVARYQGSASSPVTVPVGPTAPGIFAVSGGRGQAAMLNQDFSVNSAANPAERGSIVQIYLTGQGQTNPPAVTGALPAPPLPAPNAAVAVTIGGRPAQVQFAGLAPGLAGLLQVNAVVPQDVTPGAVVELSVRIGDISSQSGVTLAVR